MAAKPAPKNAPAKKNAPAPKAAPVAKEKPAPKEKPVKEKIERIIQNDVTRPKADSQTGKVWSIADELSKQLKRPATRAEVMEKATADDINEATVATQYQRWRVFNGVPKAAKVEKPAKEPKAPKAKKGEAAAAA